MDILVFGAGAIGGYLGSRLLQNGHRVVMLDRQEMADAINADGFVIKEAGQTDRVAPMAVSTFEQALENSHDIDLIILGLKSYDLPLALEQLSPSCPDSVNILTVQNGIGIERPFIDQFGAERIIAASLTTPVSKENQNVLVIERSDRGLGLAPTLPDRDISKWVALFQDAGITTIGLDDYESMKWSKALLNMIGNATSAILSMTPGDIYRNSESYNLEIRMLREMLTVMSKKQLQVVDLPGPSAKSLTKALRWAPRFLLKPVLTKIVSKGRGDKMPSFYIDLTSGRGKSEVIFHNGAVAEAGKAAGVMTPVNQVLNDVLLKLTRNEIDRKIFEGKPDRLAAEVNTYKLS
jgi:2-dehydropantoate 2-reductase